MRSIQQNLQLNYPNLRTKRICRSTLLEIETTCDVSGNNLPECAALGECSHEEIHPGQREHRNDGLLQSYRAGPDESVKDGGSRGVDGGSGSGVDGGGYGGSGSGDIEDAETRL